MNVILKLIDLFVAYGLVMLQAPFVRSQLQQVGTPAAGAGPATAPSQIVNPAAEPTADDVTADMLTSVSDPVSELTLDTELSGIMQQCAVFMGNQQPAEASLETDKDEIEARRGNKCRKQRGRLPIEWEPEGGDLTGTTRVTTQECLKSARNLEPEEPFESSLQSCIASCTVARQCNFITFKPRSDGNKQGTCTGFHINADCFSANGDPMCYGSTVDKQTVGFSLGDCPFAAEPSGDLIARSFGIFRNMQQDAANGLAIAASTITIVVAVAGAPCSFVSKIFKL